MASLDMLPEGMIAQLVATADGPVYSCTKPHCRFRVAYGAADSPTEPINHACPYYGAATHHGVSVTISIIDDQWRNLEKNTRKLMDLTKEYGPQDATVCEIKGWCRGVATVIASFMRPFYNDENHEPSAVLVLKETMVRIKARDAGNEDYVSPGQASRQFEFPGEVGGKYAKITPPPEVVLSAELIEKCRTFSAAGFPAEQIAESLDIPLVSVRKAIA